MIFRNDYGYDSDSGDVVDRCTKILKRTESYRNDCKIITFNQTIQSALDVIGFHVAYPTADVIKLNLFCEYVPVMQTASSR